MKHRMVQPLYELRQKVRAVRPGEPAATDQVLGELEALFRIAKSAERAEEFLQLEAETVVDAIASELAVLPLALLRWLPDDEVGELSRALCSSVAVHHLRGEAVVQFDLAGCDPGRGQAVALRLVANNAPPCVSLGWLLSLASAYGTTEGTLELAEELLDFHVAELPISSEELLSNNKNSLVGLPVAQAALLKLQRANKHVKDLPQARELFLTIPMRLVYSSLRRKTSRAIHASAEKNSIFASLVTTHRFKYATRTSFDVHLSGGTEERTLTMAPFSVSIELPITELADPQRANLQRHWLNGRGKR